MPLKLGGNTHTGLGSSAQCPGLSRHWVSALSQTCVCVCVCVCVRMRVCSVTLVLSNSLRPHGVFTTRFLHPWDFPGKNTGVGCYSYLQGNLPDPGIKPASPASPSLQADSLPLSQLGKPSYTCSRCLIKAPFPLDCPGHGTFIFLPIRPHT